MRFQVLKIPTLQHKQLLNVQAFSSLKVICTFPSNHSIKQEISSPFPTCYGKIQRYSWLSGLFYADCSSLDRDSSGLVSYLLRYIPCFICVRKFSASWPTFYWGTRNVSSREIQITRKNELSFLYHPLNLFFDFKIRNFLVVFDFSDAMR